MLIERGSEVGGGDVRASIGTVARIVRVTPLGNGRFEIVAAGLRRLSVLEWLADDPYPRADVETVAGGRAPLTTQRCARSSIASSDESTKRAVSPGKSPAPRSRRLPPPSTRR